ncbi:MAG: amidohydrolase family protein [Proteobacteria bacterium]|nr:amidohydrolase family protein [Pseudomonadota bacterium]
MQGKIALEEHFAIPDTMGDSQGIVGASASWDDLSKRLLDVQEQRIEEMDKYGVEMSILSLNAPAIQAMLNTEEAIALSKKANDILAAECAKKPDRFTAFAALPMQDPAAAAEELTRCVQEMGFKGALVNGFTQKDIEDSVIYFDGPEYRDFWKTCEALDVPFYLHPRSPISPRAQAYQDHPWLIAPAWGFAAETSIHALRLIGSGLFDECPKLQVILGHMGEHIPYDMWRIDHRIRKLPQGYPCRHEMSHYLKNNFHITTSGNFSDATLHCALATMGIDRIMFSVDYPFEVTVDAADWFDNTELSDADRQQIGRGNAAKLFGFD